VELEGVKLFTRPGQGTTVVFREKGIIIAYDLYAKYNEDKGNGTVPRRPLYLLRKMIRDGALVRLQGSVILLRRPELLDYILDMLRPYAKSIVVIEGGRIVCEYY